MPTFPTRSVAWVPKVDVSFIEPLIVTARKLVLRDQTEALVWASPDIPLKRFQHVLYARREKAFYESRVSAFPLLILAPGSSKVETDEDGNYISEEHQIAAEIALAGSDADALTIQIVRYVKAVDQMWRAATIADIMWNLSATHTMRPSTDVVEHGYNVIAEDGPNAYLHTASLTLVAEFIER
jgi:hypothetical protein